jgi:hypothetical protein
VSERRSPLLDALTEELRPIVADLVAEEFERREGARDREHESAPYLTVAQYAERHQTTPAAVRARIRRGALEAIRPPGGREYLIPIGSALPTASAHGGEAANVDRQRKSARDAATSGRVTPETGGSDAVEV